MKKLKSIKGIPLSYIKSVIKIDPLSPSGLTWLPRKDKSWNTRYASKYVGNKNIYALCLNLSTKYLSYQHSIFFLINITLQKKEFQRTRNHDFRFKIRKFVFV